MERPVSKQKGLGWTGEWDTLAQEPQANQSHCEVKASPVSRTTKHQGRLRLAQSSYCNGRTLTQQA